MQINSFARRRGLPVLSLLLLSAGFGLSGSTLAAQSKAGGAIAGTVHDPDGNAVAAAHLTLEAPDTPARTLTSAADGSFLIQDLPSGEYTLRITADSFAPSTQTGVIVAIGRTLREDITLRVASAETAVTVTAAPVTFDVEQTSSVVNVDRDRIEELPIPSRNYLTFVLLSPQVMAANPALTPPGMPPVTGAFSFGGLRPSSNAVYLDDVNDNDEYTGGSRTQLSPEAINDFQIVNHGFLAQSGGGAGGSIDVQTRTGVNRIHGDAFTFVQNGALNGTPPLAYAPAKPAETRERIGLSAGGPIQRDLTFFYIAGEQEIAHGQDDSDLKPATVAAIDNALQAHGPLSGLSLVSGFFPTSEQETELSGRIDRTLSSTQQLMVRYAFTNSRNAGEAFNTDELSDRTARGSAFLADNSLNGSLRSSFGEHASNLFSFEVARRRAVDRTGVSNLPGIAIAGAALFSTPFAGNDHRTEAHVEFADLFTVQRGAHMLSAGLRADHISLDAHTPEAAPAFFTFADLAALQQGQPDFFAHAAGNFDRSFGELRFAAFAQDHWTMRKGLTLDLGARYELNHLPAPVPNDALNLSPRVGFAWTPRKSLLLRGGFGVFYDRFALNTINRLLTFDGSHALLQIAEGPGAASLYNSGTVPSGTVTGIGPSLWRAQPGLRNPYSEVASLAAEQTLPWQTTLTGEYQFVRGALLGRTRNVNLAPPVLLTSANAAALGVASPTAQQLGREVFTPTRLDPRFDAINQFETEAGSHFHAATITLNRQFQDDLQVLAGYTFSKTIDDASYDAEQPQNPYDLRDERALSLMDQRHRFTLSGLWLIGPDLGDPADAAKNAHPGPLMKALYGLEFAPLVSLTSGFRANPVTGLDSNREHIFPFSARPLGYARNSLKTPNTVDIDLRVLKMVALGRGHLDIVAESFNLLNHRNVTLVNPVFGVGATPLPSFGKPMATSTARRVQFSLDYEF